MSPPSEIPSSGSNNVAPAPPVSESDPNRLPYQHPASTLKRKPTLKVGNASANSKPILKNESSVNLQQQVPTPSLSAGVPDAVNASTAGSQTNLISAALDSRSRSASVSPKPTILHNTNMIDSDISNSSSVDRSRASNTSISIAFPDSSQSQRPSVNGRKDNSSEKLMSSFVASPASVPNSNNTKNGNVLNKNLDDSQKAHLNPNEDKPIAKQPSCLSFNEPSDSERSRRGSISTHPSTTSLSNIGTSSTHPQVQLAQQRIPSTVTATKSLLNPTNSATNLSRNCSILKKDPSTIVMSSLDNTNSIVRDTSYKDNKTSSQKSGKLDLSINSDVLNFASRKRMDSSIDNTSSFPQQKMSLQSQKRQPSSSKISSAASISVDKKDVLLSKEIDFSVDPRQLERVRVESKSNTTILKSNNKDANDENTKPLTGTAEAASLMSSAVNSRSSSLSSRSNSNNSIAANKDISIRNGNEEVMFNFSNGDKKSTISIGKKNPALGSNNHSPYLEKCTSAAGIDTAKEKGIFAKSVSISSTNLREISNDEKKALLLDDSDIPRLNDSDISLLRRNFSQSMRHPAISAHQQATLAAKALSEPSSSMLSDSSSVGPRIPFTKYFQKTDDHKIHILLGVSGSVATIKIAEVIEKLYKVFGREKVSIQLVITKFSECFLKGLKIPQDVKIWRDEDQWFGYHANDPILHAELRKWADIFIVAPISANTLSKIANGIADNLLTSIFRVWNPTYPIIIAPAMNTFMYTHPVTKIQLQFLMENLPWIKILRPVEKILACGDIGMGGMTTAYEIAMTAKKELLSLKNKKLMELKNYQKEQERLRNRTSSAEQEDIDTNDEDIEDEDEDDDEEDDDDDEDEDDEDEDEDEDSVEDDNLKDGAALNEHNDQKCPIDEGNSTDQSLKQ